MNEKEIINYLNKNRSFLIKNPELLNILLLPSNLKKEKKIIDFNSHKINKLEKENKKLKIEISDIMKNIKINLSITRRAKPSQKKINEISYSNFNLEDDRFDIKLIEELKAQHGEELLFHQSGGCCDGSAPMCYPRNEYMVGSSDVKLGEIGGLPFYMNDDQYEKWKHTDLTIDAVKGIGGMFSLDNGTGQRFLTKSEICVVVNNEKQKTG